MTDLPKRPEPYPNDRAADSTAKDRWFGLAIDHEHAVARLAVEALEQIELDGNWSIATQVLDAIKESGWVK